MKYGFTAGSFDCLHPGHMRMFKECKKHCAYLIVGVQEDPTIDRPEKNKPIQTIKERIEMVKGVYYVNEVIAYRTEKDLLKLLKKLIKEKRIDVRIIGEDWKRKPFTGYKLPIKCIYNSRKHNYSSTNMRKRIFMAELLKGAVKITGEYKSI
jgi:glycerol-3-phosphate cytidylyltransferase